MKKLRLDLDALVVSSFEADGNRGRATTAVESLYTGLRCTYNSCQQTCYEGCETNYRGAC